MFVLGVCWARDPPRQVFGLKAQVLTMSNVKTPPSMGTERDVVIESQGYPPTHFVMECRLENSTHSPWTIRLYK